MTYNVFGGTLNLAQLQLLHRNSWSLYTLATRGPAKTHNFYTESSRGYLLLHPVYCDVGQLMTGDGWSCYYAATRVTD